jgi:hypothetical protein
MSEQGYWNGLPTEVERGTAIVADGPESLKYWARDEGIVGQRIAVVRVVLDGVNYGGGTTYLDDRKGEGWAKVTAGGSPRAGHKDVAIEPGSFLSATPGRSCTVMHNHGPAEGLGLACPEIQVSARHIGQCLVEANAALIAEAARKRRTMVAQREDLIDRLAAALENLNVPISAISFCPNCGCSTAGNNHFSHCPAPVDYFQIPPAAPSSPVEVKPLAHIPHPIDEVWAGCRACYHRLPFLLPRPLPADQIAERCSGYPLSGLAIAGILAAVGLVAYDKNWIAQ